MDPIISPWIVYWANTLPVLKMVCLFLLLIAFLITVLYLRLALEIFIENCDYDQDYEKFKRGLKFLVIADVCLLILVILIPDRNTLIEMLVLYFTTPDNAHYVYGDMANFIHNLIKIVDRVN